MKKPIAMQRGGRVSRGRGWPVKGGPTGETKNGLEVSQVRDTLGLYGYLLGPKRRA